MYKTDGLVLRTRNLGEADKVITLYTKSKGKVAAVARGSRRIRNRLLGTTQVFTYGRFLIFNGKSLDNISQGEIIESFQSLRDNLEAMSYAMYIAELIDMFVENGEPNHDLFSLILNTFRRLDSSNVNLAVRVFELKLMILLGYQPELNHCLNCGVVPTDKVYFSREGGIVCSDCKGKLHVNYMSKGTWELTKRLADWGSPRIFSVLKPSQLAVIELEKCLRDYLDFRLEKPLKSLGFLNTLKSFQTKEVK